MRLKVLGCHGGELPGCRTTCLLFDGHATIDAGALTATLGLEALAKVDDVFLTHSHFDHVKDLPLMADLLAGRIDAPVRVRGTKECVDTLQTSIFNNRLWPDFTKLPSAEKPVVRLMPLTPGEAIRSGELTFTAVPVKHPVESVGYLVESRGRCIAVSGDTGPTEALWQAVNAREDVAALFIELSFPDEMQWLADVSGHFTPRALAAELKKIRRDLPVFLYHLKPGHLDVLRREVRALENPRLRILELDDELEF